MPVLVVILALAFGLPVQDTPNFAGTWVVTMPPEQKGLLETLTQDDKRFSRRHEILAIDVSVLLTGEDTRSIMPTPGGPIQVSASMTWVGRQLVIDENVLLPTGSRHQARITYWIAPDGQLHKGITEIINGRPGPTKKFVLSRKT
jgi:hypothetical protein